jgi:threonine/homoserine/homoserine lactone efflux protein
MSWQHFLLLAGAHFLALLSPGPDFLLLVNHTLRHGRRAGYVTAGGIACANGVFIVAAISGLSWLQHSPLAYQLCYWIGCAYLAWLGWQFWLAARAPQSAGPAAAGAASGRFFLRGFLSGILNPKNALFYLTLFTVLAGKDSSMAGRSLAGLWMFAVVLGWDCFVSYWLAFANNMAFLQRKQRLLHQGSAWVMWGIVGSMIAAVWA